MILLTPPDSLDPASFRVSTNSNGHKLHRLSCDKGRKAHDDWVYLPVPAKVTVRSIFAVLAEVDTMVYNMSLFLPSRRVPDLNSNTRT